MAWVRGGRKPEPPKALKEYCLHIEAQDRFLKEFSEAPKMLLDRIGYFRKVKEQYDEMGATRKKLELKVQVDDALAPIVLFARKKPREFKERLEEYENDEDPKVHWLALWFQRCGEFEKKVEPHLPGVITSMQQAKDFDVDYMALFYEIEGLRSSSAIERERSFAFIANYARKMPESCMKRVWEYRADPKMKGLMGWFEASEYYPKLKRLLSQEKREAAPG